MSKFRVQQKGTRWDGTSYDWTSMSDVNSISKARRDYNMLVNMWSSKEFVEPESISFRIVDENGKVVS